MYIEVCDCCQKKIEEDYIKHKVKYDYDQHPHNGSLMSTCVVLCHSCMVEAIIDLMIKHKKHYEPFVGAYETYYPKIKS